MNQSNTKFFGNIAVSEHKGIGVAYTFKNTIATETQSTPITIQVKDKLGSIASWGSSNDYPQKILKAIKASGSGSSALRFLRKAHYGTGLILMNNAPDENGKKAPKLIDILDYPDINLFFKTSQVPRFFKEIIADMEWFSIAFPEYILSNNFKTIKNFLTIINILSELSGFSKRRTLLEAELRDVAHDLGIVDPSEDVIDVGLGQRPQAYEAHGRR